MNVEIPCETFLRLAEIPAYLAITDKRKYLNSLFVERKNETTILVATNGRIAAIENIGKQPGPDGKFAVAITAELKAQCDIESKFNGKVSIVYNEMLQFATIKTSIGYVHPGNGYVPLPQGNHFEEWRTLFPDEFPQASSGHMFMSATDISILATASPTGGLVFPEHLDVNSPVVVRDVSAPDWFGLFMPVGVEDEPQTYAPLPGWCK